MSGLLQRGGRLKFGGAVYGPDDQLAWVKHMLWLILPQRPAKAGFKLDPEEVADLPIHAVPDLANQLTFGVGDLDHGLEGDGSIHLQTGATQRDVLQVGKGFLGPARLIFPLNFDEVGA